MLEKPPGGTAAELSPVLARVEAVRRDIAAQLGPRGVLLVPTYPRTAPRHHASLLRFPSSGYTGLFNALELPATQVPCGLDPSGLPLAGALDRPVRGSPMDADPMVQARCDARHVAARRHHAVACILAA